MIQDAKQNRDVETRATGVQGRDELGDAWGKGRTVAVLARNDVTDPSPSLFDVNVSIGSEAQNESVRRTCPDCDQDEEAHPCHQGSKSSHYAIPGNGCSISGGDGLEASHGGQGKSNGRGECEGRRALVFGAIPP